MSESKLCKDCQKVKPTSDFHKAYLTQAGEQRYFNHCKLCARIRANKWYHDNIDYARERARRVQQERRDAGLNQEREKWHKVFKKYGLTREQWEWLWDRQEGRCATCQIDLVLIKVCVDHDHRTDEVRGLLCNECNHGLGKFKDNPETIMRAAEYLLAESPLRQWAEVVSS